MNRRYLFTESAIKELARYSKMLYEAFSNANKKIVDNPKRSINSDFWLDYTVSPEDNYYYMDADLQISIHSYLYKSSRHYTILAYNLTTELPLNNEISPALEIQKHCFGVFKDIDTAISVFKSIVVRVNSGFTANEYTKLSRFTRDLRIEKRTGEFN